MEDFDKKQENDGFKFFNRVVLGPNSFHGYWLQYFGFKKISQDEARVLIVKNIEEILLKLNSLDTNTTSTYYRFPLMPEDISLSYVLFQSEGIYSSPPFVSAVANHHDVIEYYYFNDNSIEHKEIITESYNEAYEKVYGKPRQPQCEPRQSKAPAQ